MAIFFLFLHIAAALWATAGVFASAVVRVQARRADSVPARVMAYRLLWRLHVVYTLPGLVVAGLIGFYLVTASGASFGDTWVMASSVVYLLMLLWTVFLLTPALSQLAGAGLAATSDPEAVGNLDLLAGQRLWGILSDVNALAILTLTFLMTVKP